MSVPWKTGALIGEISFTVPTCHEVETYSSHTKVVV